MQNIFAFDFSMNKPAMTSYINGEVKFYLWPSDLDGKSIDTLESVGVKIENRNLPKIKEHGYNSHQLIIEHVNRATELAKTIVDEINRIADENKISREDIIISNESMAFSAKGDATLDLSGYKYILMYTLINNGYKVFRTYSPITLKKTAGCSKKGMGKDDMIEALGNESGHLLFEVIKDKKELLKKKTNYVKGLDDIADSYWCFKTALNDEQNSN